MANTKFDSRYGSNGDPTLAWMPFCARIAPDPLLPGSCGTSVLLLGDGQRAVELAGGAGGYDVDVVGVDVSS